MAEVKPYTFIDVDLETTGLWQEQHGICQIGAWATGESFDHFKGYFVSDANPHYPCENSHRYSVVVEDGALSVNGFTKERIDDAPELYNVLHKFNAWVQKFTQDTQVVIVGQNVPFDVAWLKRDFHRAGLDDGIFRRVVDTAALGFIYFGEPMGQGRMLARLGWKNGDAHDALADAYSNARLFHHLRDELRAGRLATPPQPTWDIKLSAMVV